MTIRKTVCALAVGIGLALATGTLADEALPLKGFVDLPVDHYPVTRSARPIEIILWLSESHGSVDEGIRTEIDISRQDDAIVSNIRLRGYEDDSVSGENLRAILEKDGEQWKLVAVGKQYVCARGARAGQATSELCP